MGVIDLRVTTQSYGQFLINSVTNFTGTYFADIVDDLKHDSVWRMAIALQKMNNF